MKIVELAMYSIDEAYYLMTDFEAKNFPWAEGDRVYYYGHRPARGVPGTVKQAGRNGCNDCAVEFDEYFDGGHSCNGICEKGKGRFCSAEFLRPAESKTTISVSASDLYEVLFE